MRPIKHFNKLKIYSKKGMRNSKS